MKLGGVEPGDCQFCGQALPVPRHHRRIYCDKRCAQAYHQFPTAPPSSKSRKGKRFKHPDNQHLVAALIRKEKDKPCMDCGGTFHPVCMDFDHRPGEVKLFAISKGHHRSMADVLAELAKCDLVCSNCHRVRTFVTRRKTA